MYICMDILKKKKKPLLHTYIDEIRDEIKIEIKMGPNGPSPVTCHSSPVSWLMTVELYLLCNQYR